ncbi:MAG: MFS transporter [Acidimicrobiales bacterium]
MQRLDRVVGGRARRIVVVLLAGVLGLQAADAGAVGALAAPLESAFRIGNAELGLLVTVTTLVGCVATLPFGAFSDEHSRTALLQVAAVVWAAATIASALSTSFFMLLLTRLALGAAVAAAGPAVASLVGDFFPGNERGRLWGFVLSGELIGAGLGILVAGSLSGLAGWRLALGVLALPALVLAWALRRYLPEPARGGQSRLEVGAERIGVGERSDAGGDGVQLEDPSAVEQQAAAAGAEANPDDVLSGDESMTMWHAVVYVLRIRTNVALIVASGLGYFFFGGLQTFAELFFRERYGVGQSLASMLFILVAAGALAGVLLSGRGSDRLIHRGHTTARLTVAAAAYVATVLIFFPGVVSSTLAVSVPVFFVAAAALGAVNPPVDAARLDVMPSHLWGRAEAVRTAFRQLLQGLAPLVFGLVSAAFGGASRGFGAGVDTRAAHASSAAGHGLATAFLILSIPLIGAGAALLLSRRRYLQDVVSARRSDELRAGVGQ